MREDIPERFTEPGKKFVHGTRKYPRNLRAANKPDEDGLPVTPSGMSKVHSVSGKHGKKHGPGRDYKFLRRYLGSKVGQPWDEVHSGLCHQADGRSFRGYNLLDALKVIVAENVEILDDGVVTDINRSKWFPRFHEFYVHPETKTLERAVHKRKFKSDEATKVFELGVRLYHQHEGIWYRVEMRRVPLHLCYRWDHTSPLDVFDTHKEPKPPPGVSYWHWDRRKAMHDKYGDSPKGDPWYCISKESASGREIGLIKEKYGLA